MRTGTRITVAIAAAAAVAAIATVIVVVSQSRGSSAGGKGCAPVAGKPLVVLTDDKGMVAAGNLLPVISERAMTRELIAALDVASAAVDSDMLAQLNWAVDIDGRAPKQVAAEFASSTNFTSPIKKGKGAKVVIGTSDASDSKTMGELYGLALAAAGFKPEVRPVGTREKYEPALERGEIQVVAEHIGALTKFLDAKMHGTVKGLASSDVNSTMHNLRRLGERFTLVFGQPSKATNQQAFAVTKAFSDRYGLSTLSQFATRCSGGATVLGGPPDCPRDALCKPGLEQTYGIKAGSFTSLDAEGPLTKDALASGKISIGPIYSADGDLAKLHG
jgi:osmoprotectant transport system substrate-binding protein